MKNSENKSLIGGGEVVFFRFGFGLKSQTMGEELGAVPQQDISEAASKIDKQRQTCVDKK